MASSSEEIKLKSMSQSQGQADDNSISDIDNISIDQASLSHSEAIPSGAASLPGVPSSSTSCAGIPGIPSSPDGTSLSRVPSSPRASPRIQTPGISSSPGATPVDIIPGIRSSPSLVSHTSPGLGAANYWICLCGQSNVSNGKRKPKGKKRQKEICKSCSKEFKSVDVEAGDAVNNRLQTSVTREQTQQRNFRGIIFRQPAIKMTQYKKALRSISPLHKTPALTVDLSGNGCINHMTFGWMTIYLWTAFKGRLSKVQSLDISDKESAELNAKRLNILWKQELASQGQDTASFGRVLLKTLQPHLVFGLVLAVITAFLTAAVPIIAVQYFLVYLSEEDVVVCTGVWFAATLALIILLQGLFLGALQTLHLVVAARVKNGCAALMYKKVLQIKCLDNNTMNKMLISMTTASLHLWASITHLPHLTVGMGVALISLLGGLALLGASSLLAWCIVVGVLFLELPVNMVMKKLDCSRRLLSDKRISLVKEIFGNIQMIKMHGWEKSFVAKTSDVRDEEKSYLDKYLFVQSLNIGFTLIIPFFASCLTFIAHVMAGYMLSPIQAFTFLSLMIILQVSLAKLPTTVRYFLNLKKTLLQIKNILLLDEISLNDTKVSEEGLAIEMIDTTCSWPVSKTQPENLQETKEAKEENKSETETDEDQALKENSEEEIKQIYTAPALKQVSFHLKQGETMALCGEPGSGKTSLLQALMGKFEVASGSVSVKGGLAMVTGETWIYPDSVRENILCGQDFDPNRYDNVLDACALREFVCSLAKGDSTQISMKITSDITPAQTQLICLARAVYSDRDIVLLDEPLSHLSKESRQCIMGFVLGGLLKERTVVIVTSCGEIMTNCDKVLLLKDGSVVETGSHDTLLETKGEYCKFWESLNETLEDDEGFEIIDSSHVTDADSHKSGDGDNVKSVSDLSKTSSQQITHYSSQKGFDPSEISTTWGSSSLLDLLRVCAKAMGGYSVLCVAVLCVILPVLVLVCSGVYLAVWLGTREEFRVDTGININMINNTSTDSPQTDIPQTDVPPTIITWLPDTSDIYSNLTSYSMFIPVLLVLLLLQAAALAKGSLQVSSYMHDQGLLQVLHQPFTRLLTSSATHLIKAFSYHQLVLDVQLPKSAQILVTNILLILLGLLMIAYTSPWFFIPILPIGALGVVVIVMFHKVVGSLNSINREINSALMDHIEATVQGIPHIQAYNVCDDFLSRHLQLLNSVSVSTILEQSAFHWLAARLNVLCAFTAFIVGLLIVATFDSMDPALAGLALMHIVQITAMLQLTSGYFSDFQQKSSSLQKLLACNQIADQELSSEAASIQPSSYWPTTGGVMFNRVNLNHQGRDLTLKLDDVSFEVTPHDKVAIVGRTEADKASIPAALLNLVPLEGGCVKVDEIDVSKIGVDTLRARLAVVPQNPSLFTGSIRYNLDHFEQYLDATIWEALRRCGLVEMIKSQDYQLDTVIEDGDDIFTKKERQMFTLASALLRKSKIIIYNDSMSLSDRETDTLINKAIQDAFKKCTVFVVTQRLDTLKMCDKVLVLDDGKVTEFGPTTKLLEDPESALLKMLAVQCPTAQSETL